MRRSWRLSGCWLRRRASSASRPRPPSIAGVLKYRDAGLPFGDTLVAVLTGHGLKDPQTAIEQSPPIMHCRADLAAVEELIATT